MLDQELVEACYRAILGREPESKSVIQETIDRASTVEALLREFLDSEEFQAGLLRRDMDRLTRLFDVDHNLSEPRRIDVDVSETQQGALLTRIKAQWQALGYQDPFWSVLTHDEYRRSNLDAKAREKFYETGEESARLIDAFCARNCVTIHRGLCVELGCGVGRVTRHLSRRFKKVIAIDISEGNLRQCELMAEGLNLSNIECVLLRSPNELHDLSDYDFFYSTLTLQHNPPPVQKYLLDVLLSKLKIGGGFLFQTQTYYPNYQFICEEYLASTLARMDMHSLPMRQIFLIAEKLRLRLREVAVDSYSGRPGSYTFFGLAPARL
jgi:SAM-dependent methyltransferase